MARTSMLKRLGESPIGPVGKARCRDNADLSADTEWRGW